MNRTSDWEHEEHDEDCTLGKTKLSKGTTPGEREGNSGELSENEGTCMK